MKKQVGNSVYFGSGSRSHSRSNCFSEGFVGEARRSLREKLRSIIRDGLPGVRGCADPSTTR